jgi:hypothetical protein
VSYGATFIVTVVKVALDELVYDRMFRLESEALDWARPFTHDDRFRVSVARFLRDATYAPPRQGEEQEKKR